MSTTYTLPDGAGAWLSHGERGLSSEAIFSHLTGLAINGQRRGGSTPHDPDDLRRCRLLIEQVPAFRSDLHRMAEVSKRWGALVERWDELCALMDSESPNWRTGYGPAPKTFELMRRIEMTP